MIYVYTQAPENEEDYIKLNDAYFTFYTSNKKLSSLSIEMMKKIDNAVLKSDGRIETPFGTTTLSNLSTGCKTIINIIENPDKLVNVVECGSNVLNEIFKLDEIRIVMPFNNYVVFPNSVEVCLDDKDVVRGSNAFCDWWLKKR